MAAEALTKMPAGRAPTGASAAAAASFASHAPAGSPRREASVLASVRARLAESYGTTVEELSRRDGIPISELVNLNRGEFVFLQNELRGQLHSTLEVQDEARRALYRFKARAAQHLDATAARNWGAERVCAMLEAESRKMQGTFEQVVQRKQAEMDAREEELKTQELSRQRLRKATMLGRMAVRLSPQKGGGGGGDFFRAVGAAGGRRKGADRRASTWTGRAPRARRQSVMMHMSR